MNTNNYESQQNDGNVDRHDVYQIVTDKIIEHLEKGVIPWRQTWTKAGLPKNLVSKRAYRGINVWMLATMHHSQNDFLTFKQAKELGGSIKKGEKACPVIYWNWKERIKEDTGEIEKVPFLRYYRVFNISQVEGIPKEKLPPVIENQNEPIKSCEEIIAGMPKRPDIRHKEHRAYYHPEEDYINMPESKTFTDNKDYYSTLFHEMVHSTGHKERLNRREIADPHGFYSNDYAIEELTAEMGASYLKSLAGIPIEELENNAAYIQGWLRKLKEDKRFIIYATSRAQQATDYILNIKNLEQEKEVIAIPEPNEKETGRAEEVKQLRGREKETAKTLSR